MYKLRSLKMSFAYLVVCLVSLLILPALKKSNDLTIKVNPNKQFQTMHSFGASDAWRCQFVGANWPEAKKEQMAEWLFSKEFDERGNPKGIGLSLWRFYIGAGSAEQGDSSGINHLWRRAQSFQDARGNYNWNKQRGQLWFLKKAKEYGVYYSLAFTISAPVHMTINNKAFADKGRKVFNVRDGKDYAVFLADVCEHFEKEGLGFDYLSPINEPQWDWSGSSQEGTPATNSELFAFTKQLDKEIWNRKLDVKLAIGEAADIRFLLNNTTGYEGFSNQIDGFLNSESTLYVGDLKSVAPVISGHSYFTTWPVDTLLLARERLNKEMQKVNTDFEYWQSEFCILEKNSDVKGGGKRDLGMPTALYVARVIHNDITIANATSWQWWTAISQCDYKDGLIYLDNGNNGISDQNDPDNITLMKDGEFHDSKLMWGLGNYSLFVRPGMKRVEVELPELRSLKDQAQQFMISAYLDKKNKQLVIVVINYLKSERAINLNPPYNTKQIKTYTTSATKNLELDIISARNLIIQGESIVTVLIPFDKSMSAKY